VCIECDDGQYSNGKVACAGACYFNELVGTQNEDVHKQIAAVGREFQMHDDTLRPQVMVRESKVQWRGGRRASASNWNLFSAFVPGDVITPDQGMYKQDSTLSGDAGYRGSSGHTGLYFCPKSRAQYQNNLSAYSVETLLPGLDVAFPGTYNFLKCDGGVIMGADSEDGPWSDQLCP
jgi:hypothetical protein